MDSLIMHNVSYKSSISEILANGDVSIAPDDFECSLKFADFAKQIRYYQGPRRVKEKLAELWNVSTQNLFIGFGVDDIVNHLIAILGHGKSVATFWPAYPFSEKLAQNAKCSIVRIPLEDTGHYPKVLSDRVVSAIPKIVVLVNPTNPGGKTISHESVMTYLQQLPQTLFVVDEAYIDFIQERTVFPLARETNRLLVVRSFSKGFGLPGLRVGMAFCQNNELIAQLEEARFFFFTPLSIEGALWALSHENVWRTTIELNLKIKEKIMYLVNQIEGISPVMTETNFVLVRVNPGIDMVCLQKECLQCGLHFWWFNETKLFQDYFGHPIKHASLKNTFRISPVNMENIDKLASLLKMAVNRSQI